MHPSDAFYCSFLSVPDTSQIEVGQAQSSTSIFVKWTQIPLVQHYYLLVFTQPNGPMLNLTYPNTNLSATVENLQPSTNYDCYIYTANAGGLGLKSKVKTITTCESPASISYLQFVNAWKLKYCVDYETNTNSSSNFHLL